MAKSIRLVGMAAAVLPLTLLVACSSSTGSSSSALPPTSPWAAANPSTGGTTVSETGSTLLLPLVSAWQVAFGTLNPNVALPSLKIVPLHRADSSGSICGHARWRTGNLNPRCVPLSPLRHPT